jgi:thiol-disulfide isomerase/thioredoxin
MSNEAPGRGGLKPRVGRGVRLALWGASALGVAAVLYVTGGAVFKPPGRLVGARGEAGRAWTLLTPAEAQTAMHEIPPLVGRGKGAPAPDVAFAGPEGGPVKIGDFKGHVTLVNLWATWCAPCRKEMPTLAALQKAEASTGLKVVAISVDRPAATVQAKAFIAQNAPLAFYQDAGLKLPFAFKPPVGGFPTTLIYDKAGRERARVASDVDWTGAKARRVVEKLAAE